VVWTVNREVVGSNSRQDRNLVREISASPMQSTQLMMSSLTVYTVGGKLRRI